MTQRHIRSVANDLGLQGVVVYVVYPRLEQDAEVLAVRVIFDQPQVQIHLGLVEVFALYKESELVAVKMTRAPGLFRHLPEELAEPDKQRVPCPDSEYAVDYREVSDIQAKVRVLLVGIIPEKTLHRHIKAGFIVQPGQRVAVTRVSDAVRLFVRVLVQDYEQLPGRPIFKWYQLDVEEVVLVVVLVPLRKYQ